MRVRLRGLRGKRSQSQIEIQTGIKQRTLSGWENDPPEYFENLIRLAEYYHVSTDYLLGLTDIPRPLGDTTSIHEERERYLTSAVLADDEFALLQQFRALPDESKQLLIQFLSTIGRGPSIRVIGEDE